MSAAAFRAGTAAADAPDRIVYDSGTGRIFYDADGAGGAAQTLFARVDAGTALERSDFLAYSSAGSASARPPASEASGHAALEMSAAARMWAGMPVWEAHIA